jgi:RNase P subunit RPR2
MSVPKKKPIVRTRNTPVPLRYGERRCQECGKKLKPGDPVVWRRRYRHGSYFSVPFCHACNKHRLQQRAQRRERK